MSSSSDAGPSAEASAAVAQTTLPIQIDPRQPIQHLLPGQWFLGRAQCSLSTLLGSCVAMTLWHPVSRVVGLCHYVLPRRANTADAVWDGRYGLEAMALMQHELHAMGLDASECVATLSGGALLLERSGSFEFSVGQSNVDCAHELVADYGLYVEQQDLGGRWPRRVTIDGRTGQVHVQRSSAGTPAAADAGSTQAARAGDGKTSSVHRQQQAAASGLILGTPTQGEQT